MRVIVGAFGDRLGGPSEIVPKGIQRFVGFAVERAAYALAIEGFKK